jgi:hypothetical protein
MFAYARENKQRGEIVMNEWQLIFSQSKVNNGAYYGELLPPQNWDWPEETWFQKRLRYLRTGEETLSEMN